MTFPALEDLPRTPVLPMESWLDQLFTQVGTAVDGTLFRIMQQVVERALIPDASRVEALRATAAPMLDPALQASPERFFDFDPEIRPPLSEQTTTRRPIEGGETLLRKLTTGYRAFADPCFARAGADDPILVEHWLHTREPARGTVLLLHGFTMGRGRIDALVLFARQWFDMGLDVAMVTLPGHGSRAAPDARFSGEAFAVPHVTRLAEAVRQAVYEIGVVLEWLRSSTSGPVGLAGISLGGYLAALTASLRDDLDFVVPIVPPVCIGDLAWRFFEHTSHARRGGPAALGKEELRRSFRVHSPLAHRLRASRERVLIVAGRGDRIVPPSHPHALWAHWGNPAIHWFSGSHLAPFGRGVIVQRIRRHLRDLELVPGRSLGG